MLLIRQPHSGVALKNNGKRKNLPTGQDFGQCHHPHYVEREMAQEQASLQDGSEPRKRSIGRSETKKLWGKDM